MKTTIIKLNSKAQYYICVETIVFITLINPLQHKSCSNYLTLQLFTLPVLFRCKTVSNKKSLPELRNKRIDA